MQTLPEDTTFQADAGGLIRLILTHTVVVGSALSWVLFGTLWTRVVGASLLLLSPFLLLIYVLARRLSQVRLDDAQQSVRLPLRPVPYAEITGLRGRSYRGSVADHLEDRSMEEDCPVWRMAQ